jgi:sulfite exporter TauE/SafE
MFRNYSTSTQRVLGIIFIILGALLLLTSVDLLLKVLTIIGGIFLINYGLQLRNSGNIFFMFRNISHRFNRPFDI